MAGRRHGGNEEEADEGRRCPGPDTVEGRIGKAADSRISPCIYTVISSRGSLFTMELYYTHSSIHNS
jgi:hypothetical protein